MKPDTTPVRKFPYRVMVAYSTGVTRCVHEAATPAESRRTFVHYVLESLFGSAPERILSVVTKRDGTVLSSFRNSYEQRVYEHQPDIPSSALRDPYRIRVSPAGGDGPRLYETRLVSDAYSRYEDLVLEAIYAGAPAEGSITLHYDQVELAAFHCHPERGITMTTDDYVPAGVPPVDGATGESMDEARFWTLIAAAQQAVLSRHVLPDAAVELAVLDVPRGERKAFDMLLAEKKWALPYHLVPEYLAPDERFTRDDLFQYTLTALVLLGQETFAELLRSPEGTLSRVMPGLSCEGRVFVPYSVWLQEAEVVALEDLKRDGWAPSPDSIMRRYGGGAEVVGNAKGGISGVLVEVGWRQELRVKETTRTTDSGRTAGDEQDA
jgi:Protein of unknown function (DUF4240)